MERLGDIYASGSGAGAIDDVARLLADRLEALGADAGFLAAPTPDGQTLEVARVTPFCAAPVRLAFPADAPYPLAHAIRTGKAFYVSSNDALACDHPGLVRVREEDHACATLPLHGVDGRVIGSANVSWEDPRSFTDADRHAIEELFALVESELSRRVGH